MFSMLYRLNMTYIFIHIQGKFAHNFQTGKLEDGTQGFKSNNDIFEYSTNQSIKVLILVFRAIITQKS